MDPVTMIGMVAVVGMFSTGVALVWTGLRRRPDRLPEGAEAVLAAVAEGRIAKPEHVIDLVRPPAQPPRRTDVPPSVRLLPREDTATPETRKAETRKAETRQPVLAGTVATGPAAVDASPVRPAPSTRATDAATTDVSAAIFERVDDPKGDDFFADEPELQRF